MEPDLRRIREHRAPGEGKAGQAGGGQGEGQGVPQDGSQPPADLFFTSSLSRDILGTMKLVFLGPPGAGKGTVAEKAQKDLAVPHVSTGEIFRSAVKNGTPLGLRVKAVIESGALVPDGLTIELVRERLGRGDARSGWILDGFPRTIPQADALEGIDPPDRVVDFELGDEAVVERLSGRRTCPACGHSFHVKFMPPAKAGICDACGGTLITREDDKIEAIRRRLAAYRAQTTPLIEYYRWKGRLATVDASPEADTVYAAFLGLPGLRAR